MLSPTNNDHSGIDTPSSSSNTIDTSETVLTLPLFAPDETSDEVTPPTTPELHFADHATPYLLTSLEALLASPRSLINAMSMFRGIVMLEKRHLTQHSSYQRSIILLNDYDPSGEEFRELQQMVLRIDQARKKLREWNLEKEAKEEIERVKAAEEEVERMKVAKRSDQEVEDAARVLIRIREGEDRKMAAAEALILLSSGIREKSC